MTQTGSFYVRTTKYSAVSDSLAVRRRSREWARSKGKVALSESRMERIWRNEGKRMEGWNGKSVVALPHDLGVARGETPLAAYCDA